MQRWPFVWLTYLFGNRLKRVTRSAYQNNIHAPTGQLRRHAGKQTSLVALSIPKVFACHRTYHIYLTKMSQLKTLTLHPTMEANCHGRKLKTHLNGVCFTDTGGGAGNNCSKEETQTRRWIQTLRVHIWEEFTRWSQHERRQMSCCRKRLPFTR